MALPWAVKVSSAGWASLSNATRIAESSFWTQRVDGSQQEVSLAIQPPSSMPSQLFENWQLMDRGRIDPMDTRERITERWENR
jgi:hypothetical protein